MAKIELIARKLRVMKLGAAHGTTKLYCKIAVSFPLFVVNCIIPRLCQPVLRWFF